MQFVSSCNARLHLSSELRLGLIPGGGATGSGTKLLCSSIAGCWSTMSVLSLSDASQQDDAFPIAALHFKPTLLRGQEPTPNQGKMSPYRTANLSGLFLGCIEADFCDQIPFGIPTFPPLQTQHLQNVHHVWKMSVNFLSSTSCKRVGSIPTLSQLLTTTHGGLGVA